MKYTFTNADNAEKTVNVPDDFIARNKKALGISTKEAILLYLSDEGYISNEVVEELNAKAGEVKKKRAPRKKNVDPTKKAIIESIYHLIMSGAIDEKLLFDHKCEPVEIVNPERVIAFSVGQDNYEITLSKKRK